MHELGIATNIAAIVSEAAAGRRVFRVSLEVGKLSGVAVESLLFCFDAVTQGTTLEGAMLKIQEIEGRARCLACTAVFPVPNFLSSCRCGSRRFTPIAGEELNIKSMEVDEVA